MTVLHAHDAPARFSRTADAEEIRRHNTLVGLARAFPFGWSGQPANLRFTAAGDAPAASGWLRVRLDDHGFDLGLPVLPEPSALGVEFAGIEIAELPEELLVGVLEVWLRDAIQALRAHRIELRVEAWSLHPPALPAAFGWEIARGEPGPFLTGTLHGDTAALDFLAGLAARTPPQRVRSADALPVPVQVAIAHLALPATTLRRLAVGDALFPPLSAADRRDGRCELWSGGRRLGLARLEKQTVKLISMNTAPASPLPPGLDGPLAVDDLPVPLTFDVGQVDFTVGQLRTIGPGYTIELPHDPARLVTIRANGREIGRGELVEIGTKWGVRLVDWNLA